MKELMYCYFEHLRVGAGSESRLSIQTFANWRCETYFIVVTDFCALALVVVV